MIERNTRARAPNMARTASAAACRLCNQIEQRKAHDQEDDDPLDPHHVGLFILPVFTADYSNTLPHVQAERLHGLLFTRSIGRLAAGTPPRRRGAQPAVSVLRPSGRRPLGPPPHTDRAHHGSRLRQDRPARPRHSTETPRAAWRGRCSRPLAGPARYGVHWRVQFPLVHARNRSMASSRSSIPRCSYATVKTIGGFQSSGPRWARAIMVRSSRTRA